MQVSSDQFLMLWLIIIVVVPAAYMIPTLLAFLRGHDAKWRILVVNLFSGWSGFGWIACLFWAMSSTESESYRYNRRHD